MIQKILKTIFGSANDRKVKRYSLIVDEISAHEPLLRKLSDNDLAAKTIFFKESLAQGKTIDDVLPEAFAVCREASARVLGQRHFDVQLIGGLVLHDGLIAEMRTGEGKTLAATLPAYTNALLGRGVHVVTVNDYLAKRDAAWMGEIYNFLGVTVGTIIPGLDDEQRREAYLADITYGTNNEFGFDYLRDNMKFRLSDYVQRDFYFAIVDEVDSILIDESRTPLIISGPAEKSTDLYYQADRVIPNLVKDTDYTMDEKSRTANLTDEGVNKAEKLLYIDNLYDPQNIELLHHVGQALKAHVVFKRDVDYIINEQQEVVIVDEFTGRLMDGRRYSDGLHQALEAKEAVKIENENQTLATITFQNYFRLYEKLSGMTGTADTEATEFSKIYKLEVMVIPTHRPMIRKDQIDMVYRTEAEKHRAIIEQIEELYRKGQPVLVGTISISNSEMLSKILKQRGIPHQVLNAKQHDKEAEIVASAGQKGTVTISTNMAGRGTDIVLGQGVEDLGGLFILGTERHESRRIDNQLRGRSGRQGDPGESRFYLSLEDDLLRVFGGPKMKSLLERLGMTDGVPLEANMISRGIENAQRQVEGHNFDIRKHLLEYDDVMNKQRDVIYSQRRRILSPETDLNEELLIMIDDLISDVADNFIDQRSDPKDWDWNTISTEIQRLFGLSVGIDSFSDFSRDSFIDNLQEKVENYFKAREEQFTPDLTAEIIRWLLLNTLDGQWKDHLLSMDRLKEGVSLRGYAQKDPLKEYQREGFELFAEMIERVRMDSVRLIFNIQVEKPSDVDDLEPDEPPKMTLSHGENEGKKEPVTRDSDKVGRNEACSCGSGKKYKRCCGAK